MYGLICENVSHYIIEQFGSEKWDEVRRSARIEAATFSTHEVYPDQMVTKILGRACKVLKIPEKELLEAIGNYFVQFLGQYGYDKVLSVLGRHMRDFLNGLDNLHEYLKFSYPKMIAPSFFCEDESEEGLTLHYRSTRRGYLWYTIGQIKEVGKHFYNTDVEINVLKEESIFNTLHVVMRLTFDNVGYRLENSKKMLYQHALLNMGLTDDDKGISSDTISALVTQRHCSLPNSLCKKGEVDSSKMLPVRASIFFDIFPFCVVFDQNLVIRTLGRTLYTVMPTAVGKMITQVFEMKRPLIECSWNVIMGHTNNVFELVSLEAVKAQGNFDHDHEGVSPFRDDTDSDYVDSLLHLKGQMMYMEEWQHMVYLAAPVMRDLNTMIMTGLYINDLSMHDFSSDMVLAGQQQSSELKIALDQELQKGKMLEQSMKKLDEEIKRTDELLYQMIPRAVAEKLRNGEDAVSTCQEFDAVTVLFTDVVTFTDICSRITPLQVVAMLNSMYSLFDNLTEKHKVYKVETIGDAYMVVGGAPEVDMKHAERVSDMAVDMVTYITDISDPSTGNPIRIRVGMHSGAVVAGVVGLKMPRYCLFGDTVNTASRMESSSEALRIHISERTKAFLDDRTWDIVERGTVQLKGKGLLRTYWLNGRHGVARPKHLMDVQRDAAPVRIASPPAKYKVEGGAGETRIATPPAKFKVESEAQKTAAPPPKFKVASEDEQANVTSQEPTTENPPENKPDNEPPTRAPSRTAYSPITLNSSPPPYNNTTTQNKLPKGGEAVYQNQQVVAPTRIVAMNGGNNVRNTKSEAMVPPSIIKPAWSEMQQLAVIDQQAMIPATCEHCKHCHQREMLLQQHMQQLQMHHHTPVCCAAAASKLRKSNSHSSSTTCSLS